MTVTGVLLSLGKRGEISPHKTVLRPRIHFDEKSLAFIGNVTAQKRRDETVVLTAGTFSISV